jgi:hypothetical protein
MAPTEQRVALSALLDLRVLMAHRVPRVQQVSTEPMALTVLWALQVPMEQLGQRASQEPTV